MSKKKNKNKKTKRPLSKFEMVFCILSLLVMIGIGIYYGYRSFYYYSKQTYKASANLLKISDAINENTNLVTSGDGLHQDKSGYYYKGNVTDNYIKFGNRLFRIIRINEDNTVKVISEDIVSTFMWGSDSSYNKSNLNEWLDNTGKDNSGIYYNTIPNVSKFLVKTDYSEDTLKSNKISNGKDKYSTYITTIGISDYTNALGKDSYLNNGKAYWIMGFEDESNIYVDSDGSIESTSISDAYGVRAVFTFKANVKVSGIGTIDNPYVVDQGNDTNLVDSYVKLGNDLYKVSMEKDGYLFMYDCDYLKVGDYLKFYYSTDDTTLFDYNDKNNVAYDLNNNYINTLTYRDYLCPYDYKTGEISLDTDYNYYNIYNNSISAYIGLLNIFDYYTGDLDNFYYVNYTGDVNSMIYVHNKDGYLEEDDTSEERYCDYYLY